jgi:hypothetical protein
MPNATTKITLTSTSGGSGPNYKLEWSSDGVNYSESIDCGNISLPNVGSFVTCSIDSSATSLRLTSLNIFCTNSVSESIVVPIPVVTGNKELILNVWNKTTESIDYANVNFNFNDSPNIRTLNTTSGFSPPVYYYISGSELAVGKTTLKTKMNITASFTSSNLIFDIDPDVNSTEQRYTISSSFFTNGTPRTGGGVSTPTSRVNSQINADFAFNPTTWATLSLDLTASYTSSAEKIVIIESQNNTTYYPGTASQDDIVLNRFQPYSFTQDEYPTGFKTTSATRTITGSNDLNTFIGWQNRQYRLSVTQSLFLDNVLYASNSAIYNTITTTGITFSPGNINYDDYQTIKSVTTINDAPLTGSRLVQLKVLNNTSQSMDIGSFNLNFRDLPNFRPQNTTQLVNSITGSPYYYYVSASNIPTGSSTYSSIVNFTGSLNTGSNNPPTEFMPTVIWPQNLSSSSLYVWTGSIYKDGVLDTGSVISFYDNQSYNFAVNYITRFANPMTWTTMSIEITGSLPPAITGSRVLEYRVKNNTSASIDQLWWAFDFNDTPNVRKPTLPDGLSGYFYYVSASNVPVGDSVYTTIVNFTSSLVQPPQDYNLYMDPNRTNSVARYNFSGILRQDGVQQATFTALTASVFNQFPVVSYLNPMTWATCSFELTASVTSSAPPPPTSSVCYTIETVQSAPGECFDCSGYFFSTTDTILHIFDICSGSEIFPPVDIFVESRYSDNSTSSLLIPSGSTGSLIIATSDVQCAPLPSCGEIASPTFLSASIVALTGSISECCV